MLNRRFARLRLFEKPADYAAFETILDQAHERTDIRIAPALWGEVWVVRTPKRLGLESTLRPRGRPKQTRKDPLFLSDLKKTISIMVK